jgi:superfamily II DNA/RNA helicase
MQAAAAAGAAALPRAVVPPPPPAARAAAAAALRGRRSLSLLATRATTTAAEPSPPPKRRATRAATTKASSEGDGSEPTKPRAPRRTTKKTEAEAEGDALAPPAPAAAKKKRAISKTASATPAAAPSPSSSAFYGDSEDDQDDKSTTFSSLGLHPLVCAGLEKGPLALERPSRVQRLAAPALLAGGDVVLAAETGSGKTLAYLAPLVTSLLRRREARKAEQEGAAEAAATAPPSPQQQRRRAGRAEENDLLLVLCPNATLCEQVVRAAHSIAPQSTATPLIRAAYVSSAKPPPFEAPDVAVATPSGLAALLRAAAAAPGGPPYGALWTAAGLGRAVGAVVVDEADLMLSGGYSRDLDFLLDALKVSERRAAEARAAKALGLAGGARELAERLPAGGQRARDIKLALWSSRGDLVEWTREMDRLDRERDEEEEAEAAAAGEPGKKAKKKKTRNSDGSPVRPARSLEAEFTAATSRLRRLMRLRDGDVDHRAASAGPPASPLPPARQHVFVAATLPSLTKADAGTELERRYRDAEWVRGDLLHRALPGVKHSWVAIAPSASAGGGGGAEGRRDSNNHRLSDEEVDDARYSQAWEDALARAVVEDDEGWREGRARVLVFARDARRAEAAAAVVRRRAAAHAAAASSSSPATPFEVHSYHKGAPADAREAALEAMRRPAVGVEGGGGKSGRGTSGGGGGASGSVAVACTDAAARGLDLPLVTHVVQADFAGNASDFLHRVGRTARAGREGGKVTSIYRGGATEEEGEDGGAGGGNEAVLAGALKAAVEQGEPIEGAFSRNRSFARKVRRYGGYVARGETGVRQ